MINNGISLSEVTFTGQMHCGTDQVITHKPWTSYTATTAHVSFDNLGGMMSDTSAIKHLIP